MSIESLRLKGFKSFGKQCGFEFSRNFTAIVGPNGSGKSNILDALKWILGEASASGLRITRQSDLLFQGSSSTPQAETAEVILRLQSQSENDRASLRRVYSQDGGAVLYLDGKRILLQDLDRVKQKFNLEGEGFALIGQGEISQTIHQRPKQRRRQLDALFGIERYREKRDDSLTKLEDSQSEALRIKTLIDELQARRAEISEDVEIAVQAQGILDNLEVLRHDYYFFRRYNNEREQSDFELKKHIIMSDLEELERFNRFWTLAQNYYEEKLQSYTLHNSYTEQTDAIASQKNSIQRRAFHLASQVKNIKERRKTLTSELESLSVHRAALEHEIERTRSEHDRLRSELSVKQKDFEERENIYRENQKISQANTLRRKKIIDDIAFLRLKVSRSEAEIKASESSGSSIIQEISELQEECNKSQELLAKLTERKNILDDKYTQLTFRLQSKANEIQTLRRELTHSETQYNHLNSTNIYTSGIYPESVRIILAASDKNILHSKPQAASDVFSCSSQEIAEAIEAYLGGRQYWLLVHTMEEAQEGIDFLKANRAGRATYLALERCRPKFRDNRINTFIQSGGVIGWAMDLVKVKSEWLDAISHMMGDLLIVSDYSTGSELVRMGAKFPIATVDGDIFAPSGSITGGALRQKSGAVTARQKADEINAKTEALKSKISELTGRLEALSNEEKDIRNEAEKSESELEDLRAEINSEQRNFKALTKNIERLNNERDNSKLNVQNLRADIEDMNIKISQLDKELEGLPDIQEENYEAVIAPLKNELRLLKERLNVTRELYERVDGEYKTITANIQKSESEINSGLETEKENRKLLFELSREKVKAHKEELLLREEISRHNEDFSRSRKRADRVRRKLMTSGGNISRLKNDIAVIDGRISHLENERSQLIELWEEKYPYDGKEAKDTEGGRELTSSLRRLERELKSLGNYNLGALSEDQSLTERIDFLTDQLDDVNTSANELKALIDDTDSKVEREFTASMSKIDNRFNELFVRLFGGGEARLTLEDGDSVWDRGVEIFARPPGKKLQNISQLSGGEQSLTSIALIFATLEAAGTPLAVLDEVDAALDEYNLIRFAELAKEYSRSIQIIAMTHRRATMERADLIYGVTMIEPGLSATVGINPDNYA